MKYARNLEALNLSGHSIKHMIRNLQPVHVLVLLLSSTRSYLGGLDQKGHTPNGRRGEMHLQGRHHQTLGLECEVATTRS